MKWMTISLFLIGSLSSFCFLFFSLTFFFYPPAKNNGFGLLFLGIFLFLVSKKDTGIIQMWKDLKETIKEEKEFIRINNGNHIIITVLDVNNRFSFKRKKFIKRKKLIKNFKQRRGIS